MPCNHQQKLLQQLTSAACPARDLTLEAARDASYARKSSNRPLPAAQLRKLLDSRHERDVLEGLRRVISVNPHALHPYPPVR